MSAPRDQVLTHSAQVGGSRHRLVFTAESARLRARPAEPPASKPPRLRASGAPGAAPAVSASTAHAAETLAGRVTPQAKGKHLPPLWSVLMGRTATENKPGSQLITHLLAGLPVSTRFLGPQWSQVPTAISLIFRKRKPRPREVKPPPLGHCLERTWDPPASRGPAVSRISATVLHGHAQMDEERRSW